MWYWRHKSTHRPLLLWICLAGAMALLHLLIFLLLFFIYQDTISHLTFVITPHGGARNIEFRVAVETVKKNPSARRQRAAATKPVCKAVVHEKTTLAAPQKKEAAPAKKPIVAPEKKKELLAEHKVTPPVPVAAPAIAAAPQVPVAPLQEPVALQITSNKDIQGFQEEYALLGQDITAHWAPPPGMPAEAACTITITIDRAGVVTAMVVDTSSGMLIYDLAAQSALSELQFPHVAWGKSITITFTV